jgi:hypothetical protein
MSTVGHTTVTTHALIRRINRKLAHTYERLSYGPSPYGGGKCYRVINTWNNTITSTVDDVAGYAGDLGLMHPNETIEVLP